MLFSRGPWLLNSRPGMLDGNSIFNALIREGRKNVVDDYSISFYMRLPYLLILVNKLFCGR